MLIVWVCFICLLTQLGLSEDQRIKELPGYKGSGLKFKQYSGYLELATGNALFYWLTQSSGKQTDPVVLWLSGGPGCASTFGLMAEMGPYRVKDDGKSVFDNPYAWNQYAHIVYLDAPAGVGYSLNRIGHWNFTDTEVALDNFDAIGKFFAKFPELSSNDFYVSGESYGGTYVPMLGSLISRSSDKYPNFKGIIVGNGCLHEKLRYNSQIPFNYNHDFISEQDYRSAIKTCCNGGSGETCDWYALSQKTGSKCQEIADNLQMANFVSGLDPYFINYACYPDDQTRGEAPTKGLRHYYFKFRKQGRETSLSNCGDQGDDIVVYLNRKDVKKALHVAEDIKFDVCSDEINSNYIIEYDDMSPFVKNIIKNKRALFFNGDVDTVCQFMHNGKFIDQLGLQLLHPREPWIYEKKVPETSGYYHGYKNLDFVTIVGGGHFCASETQKPRETLQVFVNFLRSQNYSQPV